jgi:hypothetical protein
MEGFSRKTKIYRLIRDRSHDPLFETVPAVSIRQRPMTFVIGLKQGF